MSLFIWANMYLQAIGRGGGGGATWAPNFVNCKQNFYSINFFNLYTAKNYFSKWSKFYKKISVLKLAFPMQLVMKFTSKRFITREI